MLMWKVENVIVDSIAFRTVAVDSHSSLVGFVSFPGIESCLVGAIVSPSLIHHSLLSLHPFTCCRKCCHLKDFSSSLMFSETTLTDDFSIRKRPSTIHTVKAFLCSFE